jgi:cytochrome c oxidase subunit 2
MFSNASNFSHDVDLTFAIIIGISLVFLVGLTALMIYFMIRYHHKRNPVATDIPHNTTLEVIWTVVPTILVMVMFYYGWAGYTKMRTPPENAMVIKVTGRMWSWTFEYENGKISDTLLVPKDKAVRLNLMSADVIHSLYIPAFRIKEDLVPGDTNWMWFIGQEIGSYSIMCAEYCGDRHSYMLSKVDVVEQDAFNKWYNDTTASAEMPGLTLLKNNACVSCHSMDGNRLVGPSFKGIFGRESKVMLENGSSEMVKADEAYILESIDNPNAKVVDTYPKGIMQAYPNLSAEQKAQIIEYLKTLK